MNKKQQETKGEMIKSGNPVKVRTLDKAAVYFMKRSKVALESGSANTRAGSGK